MRQKNYLSPKPKAKSSATNKNQHSPYFQKSAQIPLNPMFPTINNLPNVSLEPFGQINSNLYQNSVVSNADRMVVVTTSSPNIIADPGGRDQIFMEIHTPRQPVHPTNIQTIEHKVITTINSPVKDNKNVNFNIPTEKVPLLVKRKSKKKYDTRIFAAIAAFITFLALLAGLIFLISKLKKKSSKLNKDYNLITNTTTIVTQSWNGNDTYPGVFVSNYPAVLYNYSTKNSLQSTSSHSQIQLLLLNKYKFSADKKQDTKEEPITYNYRSKRYLPTNVNGSEIPEIIRHEILSPIITGDQSYLREINPKYYSFSKTEFSKRPLNKNELKNGKFVA